MKSNPAITAAGYRLIARAIGNALADLRLSTDFCDPDDTKSVPESMETVIGAFEAALMADNPRFDAKRFCQAILGYAATAQAEMVAEDEQREAEETGRKIGQ